MSGGRDDRSGTDISQIAHETKYLHIHIHSIKDKKIKKMKGMDGRREFVSLQGRVIDANEISTSFLRILVNACPRG